MKRYIIPIIAIALVSCETTIDYEGSLSEPMIVTSPNTLATDSAFYIGSYGFNTLSDVTAVGLTFSIDMLDNGFPDVLDNATVEMRKQGQPWITFSEPFDGYYATQNLQFEEGETYEYRASRNGYEPVYAEFTMPEKVRIVDVEYVSSVNPDTLNFQEGYAIFNVTFDDPGGEQYYNFSCYLVNANDSTDVVASYYISSSSPYANALSEGDELYSLSELYSDNSLYSGKRVTIPIRVYNYVSQGNQYEVAFVLRTLDINSYRYNSSIQRYYWFGGPDNFFGQPVQVWTNMENGLGYVGGFTVDMRTE